MRHYVMSALDFIKSDDTSDVVFEDAPTVPGENVVGSVLQSLCLSVYHQDVVSILFFISL
ncbi:hypothetical protein HanXRQr2_Chr15g0696791 [Helianthus annuus]|uniref:Uncharacterized protein n=1 Tax=Helianthus annuus TaxID=4232 RepID=A0A9K3H2B2_HELAN|nr:hypothetical protein HanXRQr2_Chr15g0696791 [Helianthus annuus]